ncbi:uncharacterized protein LOC123679937 [Harmonia axyridis]|uniref:uncharacterized protein LOC123679937 n=1 Tax=Harmonia axyridis TaxID=115357 RepID=UPI001E278D3E|nr:uncharacterized protein LOC123679937 [Harmonia axyridis]
MEDFALAFMNKNMERNLKEFRKITWIDGTRGTNARNWDITVVLVKDENNIGFPVSFLISNMLDQTVQKIFFSSLRTRIGEDIDADYIMTDDDIKYFNAWCQAMGSVTKPRKLLCSWHVIKNWNIQGRNKLKYPEIKKQMKYRMRKILRETDWTTFLKLKEDYFKDLEKEGENEFLKYLMNHYFQTEKRIKMWSYCHRVNTGIKTNMAIESLNKVLKHNKMRGNQNIRIEKLLDLLEELVNDKMWKKIIETERPTANSYQSRTNREAHLKAENEDLDKVVCFRIRGFQSSIKFVRQRVHCFI